MRGVLLGSSGFRAAPACGCPGPDRLPAGTRLREFRRGARFRAGFPRGARVVFGIGARLERTGLGLGRGLRPGLRGAAGFLVAQEMDQRRGDVRGRVALLQEPVDEVVVPLELALLQGFPECFMENVAAFFLHLLRRRHALPPDAALGEALDVLEFVDLASGHECDGPAGAPGAPGAADAVDVILAVVGQVVVEHDLDVIHVEAAGGDVGGHQELEPAFAELGHDPFAHGLGDVAMEFVGRVAPGDEVFHEFIHHHLRGAEYNAARDVVEVDQPAEHLHFVAPVHLVVNLLNLRHRQGLRLDLHRHRVAREALDELRNGGRHGRGEKDGLPLRRRLAEDLADVVHEPHVQHPVRLIEDHHPDLIHLERAALQVIHHPARSANDDLGPGLEPSELALIGLPTVDGQFADAPFEQSELGNLLGNLDGEFAGGAEHQHLGRLDEGVHFLNGRDGESRCFAGPRLGLAHHIRPPENHGNGFGLNGGSLFEPHTGDGFEQLGRKSELAEKFLLHRGL